MHVLRLCLFHSAALLQRGGQGSVYSAIIQIVLLEFSIVSFPSIASKDGTIMQTPIGSSDGLAIIAYLRLMYSCGADRVVFL